jgi:hypothetical protein
MTDAAEVTKTKIDFNNLPDYAERLKGWLEKAEREIADITAQLTDYYDADEENLDDEAHDWAKRAERALRFRFERVGKLKRKIFNIELNSTKQSLADQAKAGREEKQQSKLVMSFLRENHSEIYREIVSMLEAKRTEAIND